MDFVADISAAEFEASFLEAAKSEALRISRDEIYHRLEWYFDRSHNPSGGHKIPPGVALGVLLKNITLSEFYVNLTRWAQAYVPAWQSMLFHGVPIPWVSGPGAIGIQNCKSFGDVFQSICLSYRHSGYVVT